MKPQVIINRLFFVALCALSLMACSTAKIEDPDELQRLRTLTPPADKALVYFVRPSFGASAIKMNVTCDGKPVGSTNGKRFIYTYVEPGKREFVSKAENSDELDMVLEGGQTYFIEQTPQMGLLIARTKIERIDEADGRKKLAKCKLSGDCPAYAAGK